MDTTGLLKLIVVVVAALIAACDSKTEKEREAEECRDSGLAYILSQDFVKPRLIAPSKAEFPSRSKISTKFLGDCRHRIDAYIDAQNAFGGTIRTPYTAVLRYDGNGTWRLESLNLN